MALTQSHFRFGINELAENTHGWHAAEDVNPTGTTIALDTTFLLRFCVQADATGLNNVDNEFQYRRNGGTWTNITTSSNVVRAVDGILTEGSNTTKRLSGTGTFESSSAGQTEDGVSGGTANDIVANGNSETECALQVRSADVTSGDLIEFRLTRDGGTLLDTYAVTPSLKLAVNASTSATLGALTSSASAVVDVLASLAATLALVTVVGTATVEARASLGQTLAALTVSATGTVADSGTNGSLSQTLSDLTVAATAETPITGSSTPTLGTATSSATGAVDVFGSSAPTLGTLTLAGTATNAIAGSASPTLGALAAAASGAVDVKGSTSETLAALTVSASGSVGNLESSGELNQTLGALTVSASATNEARGSASATLGAVTASGAGTVSVQGSTSATLGALSLSGSATTADLSVVTGSTDVYDYGRTTIVADVPMPREYDQEFRFSTTADLQFERDFTTWLGAATLSSVTWTISDSSLLAQHDATVASPYARVWFRGLGAEGSTRVVCRFTASDGRSDSRTWVFRVVR